MVYFAGGVSKTGVDNQAQLEATVTAASKANVSFYPIGHPRSDGGPSAAAHWRQQARLPRHGFFHGVPAYNTQRNNINNSQETLVTLAADTGGKAFLDSNDITAGITQAQQDLRSY